MGVRILVRPAIAALLALAPAAVAADVYEAPAHGLTVRDAPGGAVVETLPPGHGPIETTGRDQTGTWSRIGLAEGDGWVARDALAPREVARFQGTTVPEGLICSGTEPFWSATLAADGVTLAAPGVDAEDWSLGAQSVAEGRAGTPALFTLGRDDASAMLLIREAPCSDGMSDRTHAWQADLVRELGADTPLALRTGCCRLPTAP